jgi:hypothetical protein
VRCGSAVFEVGDLVEEAVAEALAQHCDVEVINELGLSRRIGVLERH